VNDHVQRFLAELTEREHPDLRGVYATLRIDVEAPGEAASWLITITDGTITTSRRRGRADAVMTASAACLNRIVSGEVNPISATLRGDLRISGNFRLLLMFKRLMPGPPGGRTIVPGRRSQAGTRQTARTPAAARSTPSPRGTAPQPRATSRSRTTTSRSRTAAPRSRTAAPRSRGTQPATATGGRRRESPR